MKDIKIILFIMIFSLCFCGLARAGVLEKTDGIHKQYYSNGKVSTENNYKGGVLSGISKEYYENGRVKHIMDYSNNEKYVDVEMYNLRGKLVRKASYRDGAVTKETVYDKYGKVMRDGFYKSYYNSGMLQTVEEFKNGKRHGKVIVYDEVGEVAQESEYVKGKLIKTNFMKRKIDWGMLKYFIIGIAACAVLFFLFISRSFTKRPF